MNKNYENIQWVIQKNLTNKNDLELLVKSCQEIKIDCVTIEIIPFTDSLPHFNRKKKSIFYGSTTLGELVKRHDNLKDGFFFDENSFSIQNYINKWGRFMLNADATITTFDELMQKKWKADKILFIRPDNDSKSFSGEVIRFSELKEWYNNLLMSDSISLSTASKIIVSEPYHLKYEWRLWIVNKKVIASSKYREDFKLKKESGCPSEVTRFAEDRCLEYTPHDVFVMDICQTGNELFIIECGCMNSAGFYDGNIGDIVKNVTDYFSESLALLKSQQ